MIRRSFLKALGAAGASAIAAVVGVRSVARARSGNGIVSEELLPPIRDPEAAMEALAGEVSCDMEAVKKSIRRIPRGDIAYYDPGSLRISIAGQEVTGYAPGTFIEIYHGDEWLAPRMFPRAGSIPEVVTFKFPTDDGLVGWRKHAESAELSGWSIEGKAEG